MNLGYRFFVVGDDDSIIQISQRTFSDFYQKRKASLQRFSGSVINVATVIYTLENRKPREIVRIDYVRIKVNDEGALDQEQDADNLRLAASRIGSILGEKPPVRNSGQVVDAAERFDERRWSQLHPRLPGPAHKRILEVLFGTRHAV